MKVYHDYFGEFGGRYVAEVLRRPLDELQAAFEAAMPDNTFQEERRKIANEFVGRPTPLLFAANATRELGGAQLYIKLEGLANTGAHKINNVVGQALLAKRMGKRRIIAETGAGQHGLASAAVCAKLGLPCTVYMGEIDIDRQRPNVFWMELFGARVEPVRSGSKTLKDAVNEALRDWSASFSDTHYLIGSALGPSPYPDMVRGFQSVIGEETVEQLAERGIEPTVLVACVGGGSNAIGFFAPHSERETPRLVGVEAGGRGFGVGEHASRMTGYGTAGIAHGYKSLFLVDGDGQIEPTHSVSAGLDYPGVGPELAHLGRTGRVEFTSAADSEALEALKFFARNEGVIFALESAHAGAAAVKMAPSMRSDESVVVHMSGRGDKDLFIVASELAAGGWARFLDAESKRTKSKIPSVEAGSDLVGAEADDE